MNENFVNFIGNYTHNKIAVAVSGGVDSVCLLHWLAALKMDIVALHVNHGLRDAAGVEADYIKKLSAQLNIPCKVFEWVGDKPTSNLESVARDVRYKFMTDYCHDNNIDTLLVAHQSDDQIETFLMHLSRGSGVYGLAAMRAESEYNGIKIVRPLLDVPRAELKDYCDTNNIKYFMDEMNEDESYTRVRIRKNRCVLNDALGISDDRILLAIKNLSRTRDAMDAYIAGRIDSVMEKDRAVFDESFLFDEPLGFSLKLLGCLVQKIGGDRYQPRLNSLEKALSCLGSDCKITLGHCTLRRLGDKILVVPEGKSTSFRKRRNEKIK